MNKFAIAVVCLLTLASCAEDKVSPLAELDNQLRALIQEASPDGTSDYYILPSETDLESIPQDPRNKLTPTKVALGKMLYFETALAMEAMKPSGMGTFSCSSCHIPEAGFKPGNFQGVADGGKGFGFNGEMRSRNTEYLESELDVQSARPLTMVNVAFVKNTMWNGSFGSQFDNVGTEHLWKESDGTFLNALGYEAMETQNIDGLRVHRIVINKEILEKFGYKTLFDASFPEFAEEERYNRLTASLALSAYLRTVLSTKAPLQNWLKGDLDALTYEEKRGAVLFFGKANCSKCHYEPNLGSNEFQALGVKDMSQLPSYFVRPNDLRNMGRGGFTQRPDDMFKFKVPGLYNVGDTDFYFHGASKTSLEDVIEYKVQAKGENPNVPESAISKKFVPLDLTETEKQYLVAFLDNAVRDPDLVRYKPTSVLSGQCFPNNDNQSKWDLGCN